MRSDTRDFLSLIIPVYKQEKTINRDIQSILAALKECAIPFEIIVVIDGKVDGSYEVAKKIPSHHLHVFGYAQNKGKGYAVRYGMAQSKGNIVGFMDAGGDLKPDVLPLMIDYLRWNHADIVIGSKRHPLSKISYPFVRRIFSWGYQLLIRALFSVNVRDTQVGIKLYRRNVLTDVLPRLLVKEFAFDIEILAVSYHLGYRKIIEAPVDIDFSGVSSITSANFWRIILNMLRDTLGVFYRLRIMHYYDDASKRKWRYDPELNFRVNIG